MISVAVEEIGGEAQLNAKDCRSAVFAMEMHSSPLRVFFARVDDTGREQVTGSGADTNMFRTQTLRNITDTAPYFHNGSVNDLSEAVRVMAKSQLNKDLSDTDVKDIVAFLGALTGEYPEITMPRLPATSGFSLVADD